MPGAAKGSTGVAGRLKAGLTFLFGRSLKQVLLRLMAIAGLFAMGAFLVAWSGLISISASSGHWPATRWILHFAMRNAVQTQSVGITAPQLEDPALISLGAGHYATGCAPCHGAPGEDPPLIARQMTPEPPYLPPKIHEWTAPQLFWIVKHGIKFTAMPAWPSRKRSDEVWAMVAFLKQLPDMSPARYRALASGPTQSPVRESQLVHLKRPADTPLQQILDNCARCHGRQGPGAEAFPKLAGQNESYLNASLTAFATGERHSGVMEPIAAALTEQTREALAQHYSQLSPGVQRTPANDQRKSGTSGAVARGRAIALEGAYSQGIPPCAECHGPAKHARNRTYPRLAGQHAPYLSRQLTLFKRGQRGGTPYAHIMHMISQRLSDRQIQDVAAYYASLQPRTALPKTSQK